MAMATIPTVMESPLFGVIYIGELAEYNEIATGCRTGLYPNTTIAPTFIPYSKLIAPIQGKPPAWQKWESFGNQTFTDMNAVVDALNGEYHTLVTDISWIWGAPDVGGMGVIKTDNNNTYSVVSLAGFISNENGVVPVINSHTITSLSVTLGDQSHEGLANIPPAGTYDTGIQFYTISTYDENAGVLVNDGNLYYNSMAVYTNAEESGIIRDQHGEHIETIRFTDVGENVVNNSWQWNFKNDTPPDNWIKKQLWILDKNEQWSINAMFPYWSSPIQFVYPNQVEGTSIFGGESATIDTEGNPYEVYDPYGGSGGIGGGGGPQDRYSQDTLPEGHPALNLLNSGFVKLYNPTLANVQQFAHFLFSGITQDMEAVIKRMMVNPIDYILALNMIHIPLTTKAAEDIGFCGISSGVSAPVVTEQYYEIEYQLDINEFWNSALDYSSYTKMKVYVPYCGLYDVNIDEFQNGTMWLRYVVDVVSGSVVAFLGTKRHQKSGVNLRATLYQYNGNCILSMPVSQTNWQNTFSSVLNIASMAIAPSPTAVAGMAQDIMSQKVSVQKSGSISANFGYLGKQTPYVILERPELSIPVDYGSFEGYPANHKRPLDMVHGYTEVAENTLICNKFSGSAEEMDLLKEKLSQGVFLP